MRKLFSIAVIGCVALIMAGCGATPLTTEQTTLHNNMEITKRSCYQGMAVVEAQRMKALGSIPKDQLALVLVLTQVQEQNKAMMAMATGKSYDPCGSGANAFDVQIAEIEHKNRSLGRTIDLGQWIAGAWAATEVIDSIAGVGAMTLSGNGNSVTSTSIDVSGSKNSLSTSSSTHPNIDNSATADSHNDNSTAPSETPEI